MPSLLSSLSLCPIYLFVYRVMVSSVLADRHPGELHFFRNYDAPSVHREPPYATTATFKPLTIPQGTPTNHSKYAWWHWFIGGVVLYNDMTTCVRTLWLSILGVSIKQDAHTLNNFSVHSSMKCEKSNIIRTCIWSWTSPVTVWLRCWVPAMLFFSGAENEDVLVHTGGV